LRQAIRYYVNQYPQSVEKLNIAPQTDHLVIHYRVGFNTEVTQTGHNRLYND